MMFTAKELRILDVLTADNKIVFASLGGKPRMPDDERESTDNLGSVGGIKEDKWSAAERGTPREGLRERTGDWRHE